MMAKRQGSWRSTHAFGVALMLTLSVPVRAGAESPAPELAEVLEAERYAAQGFEAYGRKQYGEAISLYLKAYGTVPSADALYNIARIYDLGLRARAQAIDAYRRYLWDPGATPDRIRTVNERLEELVDADRAAHERAPARTESVVARPVPDSEGPRWRVAALSCGAVGVVSMGVGFGFGLSVKHDADIANASCIGNRCTSQRGVDAAQAASTKATIATAGVGIGVGLMATGIALWLLDPGGSSEPELQPAVRVAPVAGSSELGMALSGSF